MFPGALKELRRPVLVALFSGTAFFLLSRLGLRFPLLDGEVAAFWPASGSALSLSLLLGSPAVIGVFLGALASNLYSALSLWAACGIAAGNAAAAYAALYLLRRFGFNPALGRMSDPVKLALGGAAPAAFVSALLGVGTLFVAGRITAHQLPDAAWVWWLTDALGVLMIAPAMLGWSRAVEEGAVVREWLLISAALGSVLILSAVVFLATSAAQQDYLVAFLLFPALIGIAWRFPGCVAATAVLLVVLSAILGAGRGFAADVLEATGAIAAVAFATLLLSAASTERRRMLRKVAAERQRAAESEERFRALVALSSDWFWEQDEELRFTERTGELPAALSLSRAAIVGKRRWELAFEGVSDEDWAAHQRLLEARRPFRDFVVKLQGPDGGLRFMSITGEPVFDAAGAFRGYRGTGLNITERKRAEERIEQLATRDALTGLPNRLLLSDRLSQALSAAKRFERMLAVIFIDLDRFKHVNDSFGHALGDELLRTAAARIEAQLRGSDSAARMGGDEFVALLGEIDSNEDAALVATRILRALEAPVEIGGHSLRVAASMGVAVYPSDATEADPLLSAADAAMYDAKRRGGGAHRFFSPELHQHARERLFLESDLRTAAERDEFVLHYQPVLGADGSVRHAEALVRWQHPRLGLLAPGQFIGIAEETGVMRQIGERVLALAARQRAAWVGLAPAGFAVAVNLSADQLSQGEAFVDGFVRALAAAGIGFHQLSVEITESRLMHNLERSIAVVSRLKLLGVSVALDDFGSGYSSLGYLKRFQVDAIKIDRSFVPEIETNEHDRAIVRAVVALAGALGLEVIAEGVETRQQLEALGALGCGQFQGYHFSVPVPPAEFESRFLVRR